MRRKRPTTLSPVLRSSVRISESVVMGGAALVLVNAKMLRVASLPRHRSPDVSVVRATENTF